jgi:hypothetical protein
MGWVLMVAAKPVWAVKMAETRANTRRTIADLLAVTFSLPIHAGLLHYLDSKKPTWGWIFPEVAAVF